MLPSWASGTIPPMRGWRSFNVPNVAASVAIWVGLLVMGCHRDLDRPIRIVLPNDYRGEFSIIKDRSGTPFIKSKSYYTFIVPSSGELHTPNISAFFEWHKVRIEFVDGRVLVDDFKDFYSGQGLRVEDKGVSIDGNMTSTDQDGTKLIWVVSEQPTTLPARRVIDSHLAPEPGKSKRDRRSQTGQVNRSV